MLEVAIKSIKIVMTKKNVNTYLIGGAIFSISYDFIWLFTLYMFKSRDSVISQFVLEILFSIYAPVIIKTNSCITSALIYIYLFLLGGMLSMLFCYNYYARKALKNKETFNPISKKSLYITIAIFIGFVLIFRSIAWLGY